MSKYEDKETASGGGLDKIDKSRLNSAATMISNNCTNKDASILDIGYANGGLLMCLKELGFNNLTGIDVTQVCVNNVKQFGFTAFFGGVFNLENIQNTKYEIVILSHVLEHIRDLQKAVKILMNLLTEDGFVYIEVPDASRYKNYFVVAYYYFDCEHINHFDADSLANLFKNNETKCISIDERDILVSETTRYHIVSALFGKTKHVSETRIIPSLKVKESIEKYLQLSKQQADYKILNKLIEEKTEVIVWGAGMYTLRLLQDSPLKKCNIISFIDKDSKKQGNSINEINIQEPDNILNLNKNATVIIASAIHGKEIESEIRRIDQHLNREIRII
jgi:SAM-dependent methyltransferase